MMQHTQIRFFAPLWIENDDGEEEVLTGGEKLSLMDCLETRLAVFQFDTELSLAECVHHLSEKRKAYLIDITQHVTVRDGDLYVCFTATIGAPLIGMTGGKPSGPVRGVLAGPYIDELREDLDGQISDGWGEDFYLKVTMEGGEVTGVGGDGPGFTVSVLGVTFAEIVGLAYDGDGNPHRCVRIVFGGGGMRDPYGGKLGEDGFLVGHEESARMKSDMYYYVWKPLAEGGSLEAAKAVYERKRGVLEGWYGVSDRFVRNLAMHARVLLGHKFDDNESVRGMEEYVKGGEA